MRITSKVLVTFLAAAVSIALAQGGPGQGNGQGSGEGQTNGKAQGKQNGNRSGTPQIVLGETTQISGEVTAVNIGPALQLPSITVGDTEIKVAPVWYFEDADCQVVPGDDVVVVAAPSANDSYLHAITITNETQGCALELRDPETGQALWAPRGGLGGGNGKRMNGGGNGTQEPGQNCQMLGGCTLPEVLEAAGIVDTVTVGAGIRQPTIVLDTGDGLLAIRVGPARVMLQAGFEVLAGAAFQVRYGVSPCSGELVAVELINADGVSFRIRNDDGTPAW